MKLLLAWSWVAATGIVLLVYTGAIVAAILVSVAAVAVGVFIAASLC